ILELNNLVKRPIRGIAKVPDRSDAIGRGRAASRRGAEPTPGYFALAWRRMSPLPLIQSARCRPRPPRGGKVKLPGHRRGSHHPNRNNRTVKSITLFASLIATLIAGPLAAQATGK